MLRTIVPCLLSLTLVAAEGAVRPDSADKAEKTAKIDKVDASRAGQTMFISSKVAQRTVALNQAVRIEFVTGARQVDNIDIPAAVASGVTLSGGRMWRLVGRPAVVENERIRTVQVTFSVVARQSGELPLPRFPLTWLNGEPLPDFGAVKVDPALLVAGESRPLPKEVDGVGGWAWGVRLDEVQAKEPGLKAEDKDGVQVLRLRKDLELRFRQGELAEAVLDAPGLAFDQAQASFIERWGLPQPAEAGTLLWVLGWTRITATAAGDGVRVQLQREDLIGKAAAGTVKKRVFDALEGGR
jgi:hypothetical protein